MKANNAALHMIPKLFPKCIPKGETSKVTFTITLFGSEVKIVTLVSCVTLKVKINVFQARRASKWNLIRREGLTSEYKKGRYVTYRVILLYGLRKKSLKFQNEQTNKKQKSTKNHKR